ncbi:MAG: phosphoribosylformylglycinamidine cyclo-ligase [Acidimicrobiia bacterium]|nr:phosphoribosylformylglycinamidine cyclo-ligase [Acidimicrobiia bacterium]
MATYREAGVDLEQAERFVAGISESVTATWGPNVVGGFGGFAAGVTIPAGYTNPVLMMSTDGVGTKLEVARRTRRYEGVGHDLVAMCVDDLAAVGARPIAFTDYLAVGRIDSDRDRLIVSSVAHACVLAGCALVGGETAEHPGIVDSDHVDLAGAALGVVESGKEITGTSVAAGDTIIGVESPNLRSNGYSLVRKILGSRSLDDPFPGEDGSIGEVLLSPSVIYAPAVLEAATTGFVRAFVHVTGGGISGNLLRVLPEGLCADIDMNSWERPNVFGVVQEWGGISEDEMFRVFNMGIGYLAIVAPGEVEAVVAAFDAHGHSARAVGRVGPGPTQVRLRN